MIELFVKKGMSYEDANSFTRKLSTNKNSFIDFMMIFELGISPQEEKNHPGEKNLTAIKKNFN